MKHEHTPQVQATGRAGRKVFGMRWAVIAAAGLTLLGSILTANPSHAVTPGVNGKIAFSSTRDGNEEIYVMDADGDNQTRLTISAARDYAPTWSPDGKKIAFTSGSIDAEIYVMDADGGNPTNLTKHAAYDAWPAWSPDGTKIAFASDRDGNQENDIYVVAATGGIPTRLTTVAENDSAPVWSPDGKRIAFHSTRDGNAEIYVMDADGGNQTNLTDSAAGDGWASWSPDGSRIAFVSNFDIYVMATNGLHLTRLTDGPDQDTLPIWAPDGSRIAFTSNRSGSNEVWTMGVDGNNATRLTNAPGSDSVGGWQSLGLADLSVKHVGGPASVKSGTDVTYTVEVHNFGPTAAENVVVTDALPARSLLVNVSHTGCRQTQGTWPGAGMVVRCTLGGLPAGATFPVSVTVTITAPQGDQVVNTATVSSDTPDPVSANNVSKQTTTVS